MDMKKPVILASAAVMSLALAGCQQSSDKTKTPCKPAAMSPAQHKNGMNPCAAKKPCGAQNPCAAKKPCAAKHPCGAHNPCAAKNPCHAKSQNQ